MARLGNLRPLIIFVVSLFMSQSMAQVSGVTATVDRNVMRVGDTFTYSVAVESSSSVDIDKPTWPDFSGFALVNEWTGNEIRSVYDNGQFTTKRRQNFNLQLQATQEGVFEIGATSVRVGDQVYRTKPITVRVQEGQDRQPINPRAQKRRRQIPPQMQDMDDMLNQMLQDRLNRFGLGDRDGQAPSQDRGDITGQELFFIDVQVDKKRVYEGEQVTATYYLYSQGRVAEIDTLKYPTLAGFWKEDIELATRLNFKPVIVNGIRYNRALLASYALFPIKAGKGVIDPYKAKCKVLSSRGFGIPRSGEDTQASPPINIEVMPVPEDGKPSDFAGAVGRFSVSTKTDNPNPKTSQPVTVTYRFEGRGNAKLIEIPEIQVPVGLEKYDTNDQSKFFKDGRSFKEFEVLLVPRQVGVVEVPPLSLSLFDPVKKQYYQIATDPVTLNVQKGDDVDQLESTALAKGAGTVNRDRILPPIRLDYESRSSFSSLVYLWGPAYGALIAFLIWLSRIELGWGKKKDNLKRLLARRVKRIRDHMDKDNWRQAASDSTNLVYFVLGELSGLGGGSQELSKMMAKAPPSFRREYQAPLEKLMKELELLAFAPEEVVGSLKESSNVKEKVKAAESLLLKALEQDFNENTEDLG